jgi:hypothetical protein
MIASTQPPIFARLGRCPLWAATGGEFPGNRPSQPARCAMIEHREGRCLARNGLEEKPYVVVSPGDSYLLRNYSLCPLVFSEP